MAHRTATASFLIALVALGCDRDGAPDAGSAPGPASASAAVEPTVDAPLGFVIEGSTVRTLRRSQLEEAIPAEILTIRDPYYERTKRFRALPLEAVLEAGFAGRGLDLRAQHYILRAKDGYTVPLDGERLLEPGGYLAIEDTEVPGWEPIGQERANPGPFYLIWREPAQQDHERYPRPWQLATIEVAAFAQVFPHVVPTGVAPNSPATRGFSIFREHCIRCHAINQQGGQVGPELNIPQNILAYRPEEQVRAYIRNPRTFRYSKMPAFGEVLSERDVDDVVAYLRAMGERQHDPNAAGGAR